jgi:hypothetical protein
MTASQTNTYIEEIACPDNKEFVVKQRADIKHKPTTAIQTQVCSATKHSYKRNTHCPDLTILKSYQPKILNLCM